MRSAPVDDAVARFVRNTTSALDRLAARAGQTSKGRLGDNSVTEAFNLATAFVDADGNHTDAELWALLSAFAGRLQTLDQHQVSRPGADEKPRAEAARPIEELLAELDGLVGLAPVKTEVRLVANLIAVQNLRRAHKLPVVEQSRHLVFTGNPGTGK